MSTIATTTTTTTPDIFNFVECVKSNAITLSIAIYLIVISYYMTKNPKKLFTKLYLYITIAVVPVFIGIIILLLKKSGSETTNLGVTEYIKYGAWFFGFLFVIYFLTNINLPEKMIFLGTGLIQIIFILMIIVALAIIYKIGYNYLYKMPGSLGFFVNIIFYIPCMLLDLLEYLKADLQQAPKAVYVLLIIELILGLLYIYAPKITKSITTSISNKDGKTVFMKPLRISNESRLSSYVNLQKGKIGNDPIINSKFAISAWVYIVPINPSHSPYNGDATVFEFTDYHPRLIYNGAKGKFKAFLNQAKYVEFDMPLQKWNHVVFNYAKSNADLFVNGELKGSIERDSINEGLSLGDVIVVGQKGGLSGGMCNMVYFRRPLIKYEIDTIYRLNKSADPPTL